MKKVLKNRKFYMFTAVFLSLFGLLAYFISAALMNKGSVQFKAYTGYYESEQYPITNIVDQNGESYYSISNFYYWDESTTPETWTVTASPTGFNSSTYTYIGIDNIRELVAFSRLCNPDLNPGSYTSFLGYRYILTNNIKSTGASVYFIPVGTDSDHPFTGVFNGNGYDITNLSFLNIQYSGEEDRFKTAFPLTQAKIEYYSMFAENSGTITNFGLINANMAFNYASTGQFDKVAMICGKNNSTGIISQVYVRDLRDAANNRSGIMPFGGYSIAGLVFTNSGTVKNCYTAYNSVVNGTVDDYLDFAELIYEGSSGTSLFFFNGSISKIGPSTEYTAAQNYDGQTMDISYSSLGYSATRKVYGSYCQNLPILNTAVLATNSDDTVQPDNDKYVRWYVASESKYGADIATDLKVVMETPILRGLEFSNGVFSVKNAKDYAFMYEMFNANAALVGSEYKYQIEGNIILTNIDASRYYYKGAIAATITGKKGTYSGATINGNPAIYPIIFYPDFANTYVTVEGFNAFGLFPYVTGEISNLNIVATTKAANDSSYTSLDISVSSNNNISTFGIISGYVDSGRINNVNVYGAIEFSGVTKAFIGGAVGTLTGNATVENVTTSGQLKSTTGAYTANKVEQNGFMKGNALAGAVGYITNVSANLNGILNTMNLATSGVTTSYDLVVGGVLGAGYTTICENLQNEGAITVGTGSETDNQAKYANLYVAGVIGRHLGQVNQSNGLTNYGSVTVYNNKDKICYVCGTVNVTPITANSDTYLLSNIYKLNGRCYYRASKIINGANVSVSLASNAHYVDTINVITNQCITNLSGVYNLGYSKSRKGLTQTPLGAKTVSMNTFDNYAPVINYECNTSSYDEAILQTVYNLRDINFTMTAAVSKALHYAGVAKGTNIQLTDVRNEGNLTFTFNYALNKDLFVSGIIEEISANSKAASLYNGGNIDVTYTESITGNVWLSGICYKNNNTSLQSDINNYNPNLDSFDANAIGSIDATINAGNITLTNTNYATGITYTPSAISSNNKNQLLGFRYNPTYSGKCIKGNINVAGITNINYSVITNTFNIGDMFIANYYKDSNYKMNAAGITDLNVGQYAYILNSGNNGNIKAINLCNSSKITYLTASGIVARNDLTDTLADYEANNGHSKQVVAFTINYGAVYAYNYNENIEGSSELPKCEAAGIVGMGLLNVVNVLNYGNIFGSETISGIFGVVYFEKFTDEIDANNQVKLANTINYGNTFVLYKGYNSGDRAAEAKSRKAYDHNIIDYSLFKSFDLNYESFNYSGNKYTPVVTWSNGQVSKVSLSVTSITGTQERIDYAYYSVDREVNNKAINGSIFSIINFNNDSKAQYIAIRYLINFEENAPIVGFEPATRSDTPADRETIFSAYTHLDNRNNGSGQMVRDTYMGYDHTKEGTTGNNYVVYSPLNSDTDKYIETLITDSIINVMNSSQIETANIKYSGVFSKNFEFYKAINRTYTKAQITENPTDAFLGDFFQFVEYSYINDALVDKIGWKELAYASAATTFARTTANLNTLLTTISSDTTLSSTNKDYSSYTNYALNNTAIWTKWATNETLTDVINTMINNNEMSNLESMLEYIFSSNSKSNVLITKQTRTELFGIVKDNLDPTTLGNVLKKIITYSDGYSKLLADAILEGNSDVYQFIVGYLSSLDNEGEIDTLKAILTDYITILEDDTTSYFNYSNNDQVRYDILNSMFSQITDNYFYELLCDYLNISSSATIDPELKMYLGYQELTTDERYQLYLHIIENNSVDNLNTYFTSMNGEIGFYARLVETGYNSTNVDTTYKEIGIKTGENVTNNSDETMISNRVELWNRIRTTSTFRSFIKNKMNSQAEYYFKATEHRNTYQSTTAPSPNGAKDGDLSYFYTSVVTPSTYFYGPYSYASEDGKTLTYYDDEYTKSKMHYKGGGTTRELTLGDGESYYLAPVANAMTAKTTSVFIADNLSYFSGYYKLNTDYNHNNYLLYTPSYNNGYDIGSNYIEGVGDAALFLYEYGYTGANNQFTSASIVDGDYYQGSKTDFGGSMFRTTDAYIIRDSDPNTKINISDGAISGHFTNNDDSGSFEIIDANGNKYTINGGFTVYDSTIDSERAETSINGDYQIYIGSRIEYDNAGDDAWGDLLIRYGRIYYYSLVNTNYHRTMRTGIYKYKSGFSNYNNYGITWFTNKIDDTAVFTSQIVDYTVDQLLDLDGVYTNFSGNPQAPDERNIINIIFNKYLCTSENYQEFQNVIKKALLETLSTNVTTNHLTATWSPGIYTATRGNISASGSTGNLNYSNNDTLNDEWTNWFATSTAVEGTIQYYYGTKTAANLFNTKIRVVDLQFDSSGNCTGGTVYIKGRSTGNNNRDTNGGNEKDPIDQISAAYNNNVITVTYRQRFNNSNNNRVTFTVPITVTSGMVVNQSSLPSEMTLGKTSSNVFVIKDGNTTIATITGNKTNVTYTLNDNYAYSNISFTDTSSLSLDYVLKTNIGKKYIDQFASANINSSTQISSKIPFEYLMYTNSQTVKSYLDNKAPVLNQDYKTMLITNADTTESIYYRLIKKLLELNEDLTPAEIAAAKNVLLTGKNNVTVDSTTTSATLNETLCDLLSSSITYSNSNYHSTNKYGYTTNSLILHDFGTSDIIIVAKGTSGTPTLNVQVTYSSGITANVTAKMIRVSTNGNTEAFSGTVATLNTNLYVIPGDYLKDMIQVSNGTNEYNFKTNTTYYTFNNGSFDNGTQLFSSNTTYYNRNTATEVIVSNCDNGIQLSTRGLFGLYYTNINDTSKTYYERVNTAAPTLSLSIPNSNIIIFDVFQNQNSIVGYNLVNANNYLATKFYANTATTDTHKLDFAKILTNLLPLHTDDYTTSASLKKELQNVLIQYLNDNSSGTYTINKLYELLVCDSNSTFTKFLQALYDENVPSDPNAITNQGTIYSLLLQDMITKTAGYTYIADFINKYKALGLHTCDTYITAAYLASDYENLYQNSISYNENDTEARKAELKKLVYNSQLRLLLTGVNKTFEGKNIQYINTDGSFDAAKFDALLKYIGLGGSNDIYGIYALASSKGIKNGDFIPDNLNLSSHDAYYKNHSTYGWELIPETSSDYANWRLYGEKPSTYVDEYSGTNNSTAKSDSVNYAFYVDMKQLKKSIATTLFEFDLSTNISVAQVSAYTMYSSQDLINEVTKANDATEKSHYSIIYYVPTIYLKDIVENNDTLKVSEMIISSKAHAYKGITTAEEIKRNETTNEFTTTYNGSDFVLATTTLNSNYNQLAGCYVYENALMIKAEDTRVYSYFDILLKPIDFSFGMEYQKTYKIVEGSQVETTKYSSFGAEESTVAALDGVVSLKLTSPVYVASSDNEFKPGSVYYELVDGEYVLTEDNIKQSKNYYSVYTKATETNPISGRTYYTKSGDTYTVCNQQPTDLTLTTYYIASKASKLPKGFDLSPYVKVQRITTGDGVEDVENAFEISNEMGDHIVKEDGSADVKLFISDTLPKGDYWIVIDLYGYDDRVKLHKLGNTDASLELIYDGNPVSFDENNKATTYILWGQPFSKYDLHNLLYLDSYTKAPNSILNVTEDFTTQNVNTDSNVPYDIGTYTITITVTPEEGEPVTYTHYLVEKDPFRENGTIFDNYGTLYKDGITIGSPKLNKNSTGDLTVTSNIIIESFSRDQGEPNYRVKYSFKNVYYSLNDNDYTYEEYDLSDQLVTTDSSVTTLYAGFNVVVTSACDTGTYTFGYVYNNCTFYDNVYYEKVTKDGVTTYFESPDAKAKEGKTYYSYNETTGEYVNANLAPNTVIGEQRKLVFPKLRIIKTPSKNALVNSATFLDQYEALGALATLIYPDGAIVPSSSAKKYSSSTEAIYSELINGSQRISVDPTNREINYKYVNGTTTKKYDETTNDYYIVGTTSEAELDRYAPTLTLQDTYSKVFRFASTTRNVEYLGNQQNKTDADILNKHNDENFIYLYVPFVGSDGSSIVLAVKTTLKDMKYEEIWSQDFKTKYGSSSVKGKDLYNLKFTYQNVTYTVNPNAGSVSKDNESLYDNYAVECENGRFWYVSYVVFSEDFFLNGLGVDAKNSTYNTTTSNWGTRIKFYNVAIIDVSNNIRFILEVDAPKGFSAEYLNNIYVTFAYNKYTSTIMTDSKQLSAYVAYATQLYTESGGTYTPVDAANLNGSTKYYFFDYTSNSYKEVEWSTKGTVYDTFVSEYGLQLLPTAYYRFNLDLPNGYVATYKVSKANTYDPVNTQISEDGAYLPPSSIVTQTIKVTITIKEGTTADQSSWGISTSNVSTVVATEETAQ